MLLTSILITLNLSLHAQLSFGKPNVTGASTIMDFDDSPGNTKGLILPSVKTLPQSPANGNFVFDTNDGVVKMYEDDQWVELTEDGSTVDVIHNSSDEIGGGIIIGSDSSPADGILVLESPNKAIILPKVENPHLNMKSPYPGTICYDTVLKAVAVFDGSKWYYWK